MTPRTIVIDPGHGGTATNGGSSPNNATGPNGLLEKNLTLDIAQRVARRLRADKSLSVILTRDTDVNPSLKQRAYTARDANADFFLSIHFNGDTDARIDGTETWVARTASAESRDFATVVLRHLVGATGVRDRGVREANFGVLLPTRHAANTAACLAEVAFLTNAAQARRLEQDTYRDEIAAALCAAVREVLAAMPAAVAHGMGDEDTTPAWAPTPYGAGQHNGNGNGNGNGKRPVRMLGAYDRRGSLLFALDGPKDKVAPPPPPPPAPVTDPQRLVWSSKAVLRNGGPDFKAITPKKTIPQFSIVTVTAFDGNFAQVKNASGTALGWTKKDNLRLLFKDRSALTSITTLAPATAITVKAGWSDEKKDIAEVYNRIGALVEGCSKASGADVAAILAVWLVESGGGPKPAKMDIRIELHVLFDEWGISNPKDFDDHFQFGTRKPFTGPKCAARSSCHRYRDDETKDPFIYPHSSPAEEYKLLKVAERVAGDVVYRCMSMGGAQVMGFHHDKLGYATAKLMFDAFDKSEAAQLFGLLDEGQDTGALKHLVRKNFKKFARVYNGSGKVTEYSTKMKKAFDAAVAILPGAPAVAPATPPKTTPLAPAPAKTKSLGTDEATERQRNVFTEALDDRKKPTEPDVTWADDANSIDYSHLPFAFDARAFELTVAHLDSLASLNSFDLKRAENLVLFALRGCSLVESDETEWVSKVQLKEAVPDHEHDRCVVGVWKRDDKKLRAFTGSTVPVKKAVKDQFAKKQKANLFPTGWYRYHNGDHNSDALLISDAFRQEGKVVVLRSFDDLTYTTRDTWDPGFPADNIHATRHLDDTFSSYGCVTVKGTYDLPPTNKHHGPWATFRTSAGLRADSSDAEDSKKFHLMLLTGREAHCVVLLKDPSSLRRLRFGSSGDRVKALQDALSKAGYYKGTSDGDMGPGTVSALVDWQHAQNPSKPTADGIFSPKHATTIGVTFAYDEDDELYEEESAAQEFVGALDDKSNTSFINCPIIDKQFGGKNVALRWNRAPKKGELIDTVVHIHGYREMNKRLPITLVLDRSGISFDPLKGKSPPPARTRPTLAIAPRGIHPDGAVVGDGDDKMDVYVFPSLKKAGAVEELITCGMGWFDKNQMDDATRPLRQSQRLIFTAHSGGGLQLDEIIKAGKHKPKEIHLFDAIYQELPSIKAWADDAIDEDVVMLTKEKKDDWPRCMGIFGHALRVVFNPPHSSLTFSCWLARQIEKKLDSVPADKQPILRRYFRAERTAVEHLGIAPTYSPLLLADAGVSFDPPLTHVNPAYCDSVGVKAKASSTFAYEEEDEPYDEESAAQELVGALDVSPWTYQACPLLDPHGGHEPNNIAMRWSDKPAKGAPVNVLVHLHGYHGHVEPRDPKDRPVFDFVRIATDSGADWVTPSGGWPAWRLPTLAIVPHGHWTGATTRFNMDVYDFPRVVKDKGKGLDAIMTWAQERLAKLVYGAGAAAHARKRLIMTAHSGGGSPLMDLLQFGAQDPDELHLFDAFYGSAEQALLWAARHIPKDAAMLKPEPVDKWDMCMATRGHALRSVFLDQLSMSHFNCELHEGLETELKKVKDDATRTFLRKYYRVEQAEPPLTHLKLPPTFGSQILANAGADLTPKVTRPSARFCASAHAAFEAYVKEQQEKARKKKEEADKKKAEEAAKKAPATTKAFSIW